MNKKRLSFMQLNWIVAVFYCIGRRGSAADLGFFPYRFFKLGWLRQLCGSRRIVRRGFIDAYSGG